MSASKTIAPSRARQILNSASKARVLVVGDVMLDQFIWGTVTRISPEAPVPVVNFEREEFMPGGAANVARNLKALGIPTEIFGMVGTNGAARTLRKLLRQQEIACTGLVPNSAVETTIKTRVVAHKQQVVRIDRETKGGLDGKTERRLINALKSRLGDANAVIVADYGKGVITQGLLNEVKDLCNERGISINLDPKPTRQLELNGLSLITPNRKEAFELAKMTDETPYQYPLKDKNLMLVAEHLLQKLEPKVLLITLGEQGMLLCRKGQKPFHIPTVAKDVFDVSGAGDTVIATFTLAAAGGASPVEAAILSNHAAGIVVGKVGTAVTSQKELLRGL